MALHIQKESGSAPSSAPNCQRYTIMGAPFATIDWIIVKDKVGETQVEPER
jgi:hypothetical protein